MLAGVCCNIGADVNASQYSTSSSSNHSLSQEAFLLPWTPRGESEQQQQQHAVGGDSFAILSDVSVDGSQRDSHHAIITNRGGAGISIDSEGGGEVGLRAEVARGVGGSIGSGCSSGRTRSADSSAVLRAAASLVEGGEGAPRSWDPVAHALSLHETSFLPVNSLH